MTDGLQRFRTAAAPKLALEQLLAVVNDERPAFIEIRNHLLGTLASKAHEDDDVMAYLLDLGQSMTNLIGAIDALDIAKRRLDIARRDAYSGNGEE